MEMTNKYWETRITEVGNEHGEKYVIREDGDGLGLVELFFVQDDGRQIPAMGLTMTPEWARAVAAALFEQAEYLESRDEE